MERIYRTNFTLDDDSVDRWGYLKPSKLLFYAQEAAGSHCRLLGADGDMLDRKNLFWAVTRHRVLIYKLPRLGQTITVETWPMPTTKVAYPRAMAAYDSDGQLLFQSVSLWVLMDREKRTMVLPGKSGVEVLGTQRGNELQLPHGLVPAGLGCSQSRTVTYSCLDRNGHMNNTYYLDWVTDLLRSDFHREHRVREFLISYSSEAREGQTLQLSWSLSPQGVLQVDAHRKDADNCAPRVFSAQVLYD